MEQGKGTVCVTGGTGYVASWLVMRLLQHGYTVRATVRSHPEHEKKDITYLTSLPGAAERLQIFNADLELPDSFSPAVEGCAGVFHVAHPIDFEGREENQALNQKALRGTLGVLRACVAAKTVRRVVYTSSSSAVILPDAAEDEEVVDESTWSDVELVKRVKPYGAPYFISKIVCERAATQFAEENGLHLVSVVPSLVGGPFITPHIPSSVRVSMALIFGLLYEMLRSAKVEESKTTWKVLIMDKVTLKVMSSSCKMADITDEGVSLVEDLFRRRQPLPSMDAVYFIQPSKENIVMFLSDMSGRVPLYRKAFVFFSSPIPKELVNHIKSDSSVLPRIGALREMNLEYFSLDSQGFSTDHERALGQLYGDGVENTRNFNICFSTMATRIATVFASLKEFPYVWYRAAKPPDESTYRDLIPTKLAAAIMDHMEKYKSSIPNFPNNQTCELLILDRSVDQIAPLIHEWTYDAMCHDLLEMDGSKYVHVIPSKTGGESEKKEVLLEDHDPVWLELRHAHIADASERLHEKMTNFVSKNKAAQLQQGARDGSEISTRDLQKMVQALPQYNEQMEKLSLHVEIAGKINKLIRDDSLRELGQLEQDLVFGDAGAKEVINFLRSKQDASYENKLRLLMIYSSISPDKFEGDKATKLMQLAKLSPEDMKAVNNMKLLEGQSGGKKTSAGSFALKFDGQKRKQGARKDRTGEEETWQLSRFYPIMEELLEKLNKGELPKNEFKCMNEPTPTTATNVKSGSSSTRTTQTAGPHSMRSRRTATWAKQCSSDDGSSSDSVLRAASNDFRKMGQRLFVFVIGGATRSELRVCHKLTAKLKREVVLGATSIDDPLQYLTKLKLLNEKEPELNGLGI